MQLQYRWSAQPAQVQLQYRWSAQPACRRRWNDAVGQRLGVPETTPLALGAHKKRYAPAVPGRSKNLCPKAAQGLEDMRLEPMSTPLLSESFTTVLDAPHMISREELSLL